MASILENTIAHQIAFSLGATWQVKDLTDNVLTLQYGENTEVMVTVKRVTPVTTDPTPDVDDSESHFLFAMKKDD